MYGPARCLPAPFLLLALLVASCGPDRTATTGVHFVSAVGSAIRPATVTTGPDALQPLPDGPTAFAAIADALASARRTIDLELYEFQRQDLAAMVLDAHDRGVEVTAIMDPTERSSETVWSELEQGGVRVIPFPIERLTIDHVKLLIVDGELAIVGGINWGTRSPENHDFDVAARGPVVDNLERVFKQDLAIAGNPVVIPPPMADRLVQVLVTRPGDGIHAAALGAIAAARRSIDIEMFVLSDRVVLNALIVAAQSGIRVRVLLDPTQPQNVDTLATLRSAGADVRFYLQAGDELLHAKLGIFDEQTVLFGSCNWSRSGFTRNHELDLLIRDETLTRTFLDRLDADWATSSLA